MKLKIRRTLCQLPKTILRIPFQGPTLRSQVKGPKARRGRQLAPGRAAAGEGGEAIGEVTAAVLGVHLERQGTAPSAPQDVVHLVHLGMVLSATRDMAHSGLRGMVLSVALGVGLGALEALAVALVLVEQVDIQITGGRLWGRTLGGGAKSLASGWEPGASSLGGMRRPGERRSRRGRRADRGRLHSSRKVVRLLQKGVGARAHRKMAL